MKQIAIFASGAGTNAARIIASFKNHEAGRVALIGCNKPGAGVLGIAAQHHVPSFLIERERFFRGDHYLPLLQERSVDLIVLAGFLWKLPPELVTAFPRRIVNIHPALLPRFGGKGMYGLAVHEAVIASGETESGITIHYVDEQYDHGDVILQQRCRVEPNDTPETLASKIHQLEYAHYPRVIEELVRQDGQG